jgi:hypothetical protein
MAGAGPMVRRTLVAPMVPLPWPRISTPPAMRLIRKPTGMEPIRYTTTSPRTLTASVPGP